MNKKRRRRAKPWRIFILAVLVAGAVYVNQVIVPTIPPLFIPTPTPTRSPETFISEGEGFLAEGKIVVCDRYFDATVVYQGFARGLDTEYIAELHRIIFEDLKPDITLLLDLPPQIGLARAWQELNNGNRAGSESRFEEETISFHEKVRAGYLELARREPERFKIMDASRSIDEVQAEIRKVLAGHIK